MSFSVYKKIYDNIIKFYYFFHRQFKFQFSSSPFQFCLLWVSNIIRHITEFCLSVMDDELLVKGIHDQQLFPIFPLESERLILPKTVRAKTELIKSSTEENECVSSLPNIYKIFLHCEYLDSPTSIIWCIWISFLSFYWIHK